MTPPRPVLNVIWFLHQVLRRVSGGRIGTSRAQGDGLGTLFLHTVGRKSGQARTNGLFYVVAGADLVVVASNAGADTDPAWWLNLRARPEAHVEIAGERRPVRARPRELRGDRPALAATGRREPRVRGLPEEGQPPDPRRHPRERPGAANPAMSLQRDLEALAGEKDFSGVVAVTHDGKRLVEFARGAADRANARPNALATRFGLASATKGLTALTVASLIDSGDLRFDTTVRSLLGEALPMIDDAVTIEQLLGHTSGIGDYLDEDAIGDIDDYVMTLPVHLLDAPTQYLPELDGHPQTSPPGTRFAYNNGGYVVLSVAVEMATGRDYYELVQERVLDPAGMAETGFERSDALPTGAAMGYLADGRSNILHLPVRGAGDGGAYSTVRDLEALWRALFAGRILPMPAVERLVQPRHDVPSEGLRYGLGFWLRPDRDTVMLEGMDAGVSCRTAYDRRSGLMYTVISNTSSGAWPIVGYLDAHLPALADREAGMLDDL